MDTAQSPNTTSSISANTSSTPHFAAPTETPASTEPVLHSLDGHRPQKGTSSMSKRSPLPLLVAVVAIVAGVATGWGGAQLESSAAPGGLTGTNGEPLQQVATGQVKDGDVFGVADEKTFKDTAEGYLQKGGVDGEGSHSLLRAGGVSQTVYLTSSVTDLDKFEGMTVKVWGETFKGQKAGWLMDVGRVQIVSTQGQAPAEE
jgi:hypothetical protein